MVKNLNKLGAVEADSLYCDNVLVGRDIAITLPEIANMTADVNAMGTMSLPLQAMVESMEMSVTRIGADANITLLTSPKSHKLEARWVQSQIKTDGTTAQIGCKAFLTVLPKKLIPEIALEVGSASEHEYTFEVSRYQLYVDGKEKLCIDRLAQILRVNGTDYYKKIGNML